MLFRLLLMSLLAALIFCYLLRDISDIITFLVSTNRF